MKGRKIYSIMLLLIAAVLAVSACGRSGTGFGEDVKFVREDLDTTAVVVEGEDPEMYTIKLFPYESFGYNSFRIPCLATATNGNLIAFAEGRVNSILDYGDIDLVYRTSYDNGATWSGLKKVVSEGAGTWGNPVAVTDKQTGRIWLFMSWNDDSHAQNGGTFGGKTYLPIDTWGQRRVFASYSDDHGDTWSTPQDLTNTLLPPSYTWDAMGPGIGIQTEAGPVKGRLIIPAGGRNIYSDDHGVTWKYQLIPGGTFEGTITELADGTLMRNDRAVSSRWNQSHTRFISKGSIESDFSNFTGDPNLPDPRCQASIVRYSYNPSVLLFLNAANNTDDAIISRCKMTVRASYDDGASWKYSRLLYPNVDADMLCAKGLGGYSSLIVTGDGKIGALSEVMYNESASSVLNRRRSIDFHKFNLKWVTR